MGEVRTKVHLENYDDEVLCVSGHRDSIRSRDIEAVVDTGAVMSLLPQDLVQAMGYRPRGKMLVTLADDNKVHLDVVSGVSITIRGRQMLSDCLVGPAGCEALIGQLVLEELDLIVDPRMRTLTPRPESPDFPTLNLKLAAA